VHSGGVTPMDSKIYLQAPAVTDMPDHTVLCGDVVMVNVEGPSPEWVLELTRTKAGNVLLRRVLAGIIARHEREQQEGRP